MTRAQVRDRVRGLYVIMDTATLADRVIEPVAEQVLAGGARILQYRDKGADHGRRLRQATALAKLCRGHAAMLIINDDADLALAAGADGVHVGKDDAAVARLRARHPGLVIGASCYDSIDLASEQVEQGADYLAFGAFFPSPTKPGAVHAPVELLTRARRQFELPLVAIGGIMASNTPGLIESGADAVAVISAILNADDPQQASAEIAALFD